MIATQKFSGMIFCVPQEDVWCTYGARYEHAPNFFNSDIINAFRFPGNIKMLIRIYKYNLKYKYTNI